MARIIILFFVLFTVPAYSLTLSLEDCIYLALRNNPHVQQAQLNLVLQKLAVSVERWQLQPHCLLQATLNQTKNINIQPSASWTTSTGAQMTMLVNQTLRHYPALTMQIIQPLLRGFGKPIVEAALYNAIDNEKIARLNVEISLRAAVTAVILAYLNMLAAQAVVDVDKQSLKRAQLSVRQTRLFVKAGRKAGVELIAAQAEAANAVLRLENNNNNLLEKNHALLTTIGIDPNTAVRFHGLDINNLIKKYYLPVFSKVKNQILENDIQYQIDQIVLQGMLKRSVALATDRARWQLNLTAAVSKQNQQAALNLVVPLDDKSAKFAISAARIALRQAELALQQEKWLKQANAVNTWQAIFSAQRALKYAEASAHWQKQVYEVSFKKYSLGMIDGVAFQSVQNQLVDSQHALVNARIRYLQELVNFDCLLGNTLKTWKVEKI